MFDLAIIFGGTPPALPLLLLVGTWTGAYVLYYTGQSRKLTHIPSTVSGLPLLSFLGALNYSFDSRKVVDAGSKAWPNVMFKVPDLLEWLVLAHDPKLISEILNAPENLLSSLDAVDEILQFKYTLGAHLLENPYHTPVIRGKLTRALPQLMPDVHEEIVDAFNEFIPLTNDWTSVNAVDTFLNIVCRASNRIFVGRPLCRNPEYVAFVIQFIRDFVVAGTLIRIAPPFLRSLVQKLVSNVPKRTEEGLKYFAPLIAARQKEREENQYNYETQPDLLKWLLDEEQEKEVTDLTLRILAVNFAAIHTSSITFTHGLYYLAAFPEYVKPLREEVEEVIQREGWTKAGIDQMQKIDSFLKESLRLHPTTVTTAKRVAVNDFTFSDGTTVPRGTTVAVALDSIHFNDEFYPNPLKFDPFRFVQLAEQDDTGKRFDLVTTGIDSLGFGHGRHSCPGRFFAASQIKLMLAHVVMNYDIKFENEGVRPEDNWLVTSCIPNQKAKVLFRKRVL